MPVYPGSIGGDIGSLLRLIQEEKAGNIANQPPNAEQSTPIRDTVQTPVVAPESPGTSRVIGVKPEGVVGPQAPQTVSPSGMNAAPSSIGPLAIGGPSGGLPGASGVVPSVKPSIPPTPSIPSGPSIGPGPAASISPVPVPTPQQPKTNVSNKPSLASKILSGISTSKPSVKGGSLNSGKFLDAAQNEQYFKTVQDIAKNGPVKGQGYSSILDKAVGTPKGLPKTNSPKSIGLATSLINSLKKILGF